METKKILGLDLGTNSIGASLVNLPKSIDDFGKYGSIEWLGSRIIPVEGDYLQKFESGGQAETKAAARRKKRGSRRLKHRYKLRRTRLIQVFKILGWIDESFPEDFKKRINDDKNFKFNISDYLPFSDETIEEATELLGVKDKRNKKRNIVIPEDWIVYYLRKKALTKKITISELARIIYMMNQRRGFKSSRKDLKDDNVIEIKKAYELIIKSVELKSDEKNKKGQYTFVITPTISEVQPWEETLYKKPEWEGKKFKYVVTWRNGKQLKPQRATTNDWEAVVVALDNEMEQRNQHPGEFFFDELVKDKNYKIRQFPILRKRYKSELDAIWKKQLEERMKDNSEQELLNDNKLEQIACTLYKHNLAKQKELKQKGLFHIISEDIIYYQRELKSQKNSVGECQYEKHKGIDGEIYGVKCSPKSSPEFQEFRIWQDIHNIRILEKEQRVNGITKIDADVTKQFINEIAKEKLFELFDSSKEVSEQNIFDTLNFLSEDKKLNSDNYRINLFSENRKKLLGNETKEMFRKVFRKFDYETEGEKLLSDKIIFKKLWHIIYSISSSDLEKSSNGILAALGWNKENTKRWKKEGEKNSNWQLFKLPKEIAEAFSKMPEMKKQYASYSIKAINKLLPLMRCGKYWKWDAIHNETKERIENILTEGWDFTNDKRTGKLFKEREFANKEQFSGLPVWMSCYVAYGRHSERESDKKYSMEDIKTLDIMKLIPNNSLRNPVVEQVVRETLFLVKDICNKYGQPDEIHIELGRELKKNAKEKESITKNIAKNFEEKQRIKKLLYELLNGDFDHYNENGVIINDAFKVKPNPENPIDIEKFRIYKSCGAITSDEEKANWDTLFRDGKKERIPTSAEIKKYALWLSQKCCSPYTGKIIPLSKLFDKTQYEIEHIIPQSKLKYDAFENLVISEAAINPQPYKGNILARNFIKQFSGSELNISGKTYKILTEEEYETHCKKTFKGKKLKNLLATEIPEDFIERQINDTRYITRKISELLYPFAKDKSGLVFTIGSITSELKNEWGLNSVWKDILKPRFQRLEKISEQQLIFKDAEDENKFHYHVPQNPYLELKRIDHRHHALDALVIAATTREHIRYLNSLNAVDNNSELQKVKRALVKGKIRDYKLPWENFTKDAREKLNETVVTFKSNNRIVSKPFNKYVRWIQNEDGSWEKKECYQEPNKKWMAVRKSMFKEPQGIIWLKEKKEVPVLEAFRIQIERMKVEDDIEKRRTASYVYDQMARPIIKTIINNIGLDLHDTDNLISEIQKYLKKNSKKIETGKFKKNAKPEYKTVYVLEGYEYEKIEVAEFVEYAAKRVKLDNTFTHDKINKIPYQFAGDGKMNIAKLLHQHLEEYENDENKKASEAFVGEGLEALAKKAGRRIDKVTIYEKKSPDDKFGKKYVEVDKGAIAYFIIYENEQTKERPEMYSLATHKAIERIVQGKPIADKKEGFKTIILSPNDLVYVPTEDELKKIKTNAPDPIDWNDKKRIAERIYKMISSSKGICQFVQHHISKAIIPSKANEKIKGEIDWHDKSPKTMDGKTVISDCCIKIEVDRLGNIKPAIN